MVFPAGSLPWVPFQAESPLTEILGVVDKQIDIVVGLMHIRAYLDI
jgi:hypothetical protein